MRLKQYKPPKQQRKRRQRGSALILALILALQCAVLMSIVGYRSTLTASRTSVLLSVNTIPLYGNAAETLAQAQLVQDFYTNSLDTISEDWAQPIQLPFGEGALDGQIYELQGCFNLNNLALSPLLETPPGSDNNDADTAAAQTAQLEAYQAQFSRLLNHLLADVQTPGNSASDISNAIIDWLDSDTIETIPGGAEDVSYSRSEASYRTANSRLASLSELRLIRGVTPEIYAVLTQVDEDNRRSLCVLPEHNTSININFATASVLASLHPDFSADDGKTLFEAMPFDSHNEFLEHPLFDPDTDEESNPDNNNSLLGNTTLPGSNPAGNNPTENNEPPKRKTPAAPTSVVSSYFLGRGTVTIDERTITLFSLLKRDGDGQVQIISRSRNIF